MKQRVRMKRVSERAYLASAKRSATIKMIFAELRHGLLEEWHKRMADEKARLDRIYKEAELR